MSLASYPRSYLPPPAPVLVVPEGTTATTPDSASWSSVASLVPLSSPPHPPRLPKAPVFIRAPPAFVRLDDDASDVSDPAPLPLPPPQLRHNPPPSKVYDFDEDFPSIAASDSTAAPDTHKDRDRDRSLDFDLRRSLARRSSGTASATVSRQWSKLPSSPSTITTSVEPPALTREKLQQFSDEQPRSQRRYDFTEDFVSIAESDVPTLLPDRQRPVYEPLRCAASEHGDVLAAHPRSSIASSIKNRISLPVREERSRISFRRRGHRRGGIRPSVEESILHDWRQAAAVRTDGSDDGHTRHAGCAAFLSRMFANKEGDETSKDHDVGLDLLDDSRIEDMQFVSILAYEEFMHSPNRPSTVTKLLSRLRRN